MSYMEVRLNDIAQEQGASVLPIKQPRFNLWKSTFWDAARLRDKIPLKRLPTA